MSVLATLTVLSRTHVFTTPTPAAASDRPPIAIAAPTPLPAPEAGKATTVASNASTCHAIIQRLSGSLAATPSTADKPGTMIIGVDKTGMMMVCNHSDSIAVPVPGGKPR